MNKPTAEIERWSVMAGCLMGHIVNHNRQIEFKKDMQLTSPLLHPRRKMKEGDTVETENTLYELGKPAS